MSAENKSSPARACKSPAAILLFVAVAAIGLGGDLWTKHVVFTDLMDRNGNLSLRVEHAVEVLTEQTGRQPTGGEVLHALGLRRPLALGMELRLSTNPGVVFGLPMPRWMVQAATVLAMLLVGGLFAASTKKDRWLHVASGLILAGALGNLYDRLFTAVALPGIEPIRHEVRDFIDCSAWYYPPVFNVADIWLVVGVAMIFIYWLRTVPSQLASQAPRDKTQASRNS